MVAHERRLDSIAANLANVDTPGFKRTGTTAREFSVPGRARVSRGLELKARTDFTQGTLKSTGLRTDFALHGDGFFAVEAPEGEVLTRNGSFRLSPKGVLETDEGYAVAWRSRGALIDPNGAPIVVDSQGKVRQGLFDLGQMRVVNYEDKSKLGQTTGGYWYAPDDLEEATVTASVHQFSLEESNSEGMEEIIAMIGVQRAFGSVSNLIQSIEESYRRLARLS